MEALCECGRLREALEHLEAVIDAYDHADRHIRQKLQPEFKRLGELRLASWWHGFYDEVDHARAFLNVVTAE